MVLFLFLFMLSSMCQAFPASNDFLVGSLEGLDSGEEGDDIFAQSVIAKVDLRNVRKQRFYSSLHENHFAFVEHSLLDAKMEHQSHVLIPLRDYFDLQTVQRMFDNFGVLNWTTYDHQKPGNLLFAQMWDLFALNRMGDVSKLFYEKEPKFVL